MEMNYELFGFLIDNDIQLDIANKRLTRISAPNTERSIIMGAVLLNGTTVRLLTYLLMARVDGEHPVPRQDIFKYVWEDVGLSASSQQLWKTMNELKLKLSHIGLNQDFIIKKGSDGYLIKQHCITKLFCC